MGLEERIILPGYLLDDELVALLESCQALIFPSLFEGFGMPVLEAMAFGKPVLCSNVTSLPEVAGDAALYFHPERPMEIVRTIERIETEPGLIASLVERGYRRLTTLGTPDDMAQEYLWVFRQAVTDPRSFTESLHGVYQDGWTSERVVITYSAQPEPRQLEMLLHVPLDLPHERVLISVFPDGEKASNTFCTRAVSRRESGLAGWLGLTRRDSLASPAGHHLCIPGPLSPSKALWSAGNRKDLVDDGAPLAVRSARGARQYVRKSCKEDSLEEQVDHQS